MRQRGEPYYTVSYGQDKVNGENVGNSFSRYLIGDLLREQLGYDGVVCTDWGITHDEGSTEEEFAGKCWGVEGLTEAQRHLKALEAGVDQFGGNNDVQPVLEAYRLGCEIYGEVAMRKRFERSRGEASYEYIPYRLIRKSLSGSGGVHKYSGKSGICPERV